MDKELALWRDDFGRWVEYTNAFRGKKRQETPRPPDKKSEENQAPWSLNMIRVC